MLTYFGGMSKAKEAGDIKLKDGLTVKEALGLFLRTKAPNKPTKRAAVKRKGRKKKTN